jgi:hypothetical protein
VPQRRADVGGGDLLVAEDLLHQVVVEGREDVEQLDAVLGGLLLVLVGNVDDLDLLAVLVVVDRGRHRADVDDAQVAALGADGQLDHRRNAVQAVLDHRDAAEEVGADAVHLVHEADARNVVLVGLAPDGLGLGLDTGDGVEDRDGSVENAQRALYLDREVDVAGGVDDVDAMSVPLTSGRGRGDGDAALLLLDHPVHRGGTLVHLTDLVVLTGVEQDALGRRGLARVDVRHDADVSDLVQGEFTCGHFDNSL